MFSLRIVQMALRGLYQNLLRSMLATLGVVIGVGAVVSAVSILEGAQYDILDRFESMGADQLIIINGKQERHGRSRPVSSLTVEDAEQIARDNPSLVKAVSPQYSGGGQAKYLERNTGCAILGADVDYATINSYKVVNGRFLTKEDVRGSRMHCVLGHEVANDLFGAREAVGKNVKLNGKTFIVIGVMEERGTIGFFEVDSQVIIPISTAMGRMFGARHLSMIVVQSVETEKLAECIEAAKKTLRATHRIRAGKSDDFTIFTQERMKQQLAQIARIFGLVLYSIAGISLLVGAIGIMNIMLVSVTERTREIGVRIAVGARRFDILRQFLFEAGIISLLGGAFGVLMGWAMANFLGEFTQVLQTRTPPMIIVFALVMAVLVGVISGIYPAIRAARLDPVLALRYE